MEPKYIQNNALTRYLMHTAEPVFSWQARKVRVENKDTGKKDVVLLKDIVRSTFIQIKNANTPQKKLEAKAILEKLKQVESSSRSYFQSFLKFLGVSNIYAERDKDIKYMEDLLSLDDIFYHLMDKIEIKNPKDIQNIFKPYDGAIVEKSDFKPRAIIIQVKDSDTKKVTTNFDDLYKTVIKKIEKAETYDELEILKINFQKLKSLDLSSRKKNRHWKARNSQIDLSSKKLVDQERLIKENEHHQESIIIQKINVLNKMLEKSWLVDDSGKIKLEEDQTKLRNQILVLEKKLELAKTCQILYKKLCKSSPPEKKLEVFSKLYVIEKSYRLREFGKIHQIDFEEVEKVIKLNENEQKINDLSNEISENRSKMSALYEGILDRGGDLDLDLDAILELTNSAQYQKLTQSYHLISKQLEELKLDSNKIRGQ